MKIFLKLIFIPLVEFYSFFILIKFSLFFQQKQITELESKHELVMGIRKFLQSLPRAVVIVMRYLFAFLNQ